MIHAEPEKAFKLLAAAWKHRLLVGVPRLVKEERQFYVRLRALNEQCWQEFQAIQRKNPRSLVVISPFTVKARPFVGQPVPDQLRPELDAQGRLWRYLRNLATVLQAFKWPETMVAGFKLLSYYNSQRMVDADWMKEFEEHDHRLAAMINQGMFAGRQRKLSVLEARQGVVFDLPPAGI
jgi:hypothetical protein